MKNKIILVILIIAYVFLLTGCWNYSEIDNEVIATGIAIDKGENGYKYLLTAELVVVTGGGPTPTIGSETVEVNGETIFEAFRNLITLTSKKVYTAHLRTIIVSKQVAEEGILDVIDLVMRDHELRQSINILVSKEETAKAILKSKPITTTIGSYEISQSLTEISNNLSKSVLVEIYKTANILENPGISLTLPCISVVKSDDKETFKTDGIAVFKKDKLVGFLSGDEAKYYNFIINSIKGGTVLLKNVNNESSDMTFEVFRNSTSVDYTIEGDELHFTVKVNPVLGLSNYVKGVDFSSIERRKKLNELLEKQIEDDLEKIITKVQKEMGVDIFGFGKEIYDNDPKIWSKYEENWDEVFTKIKVDVEATIKIHSSGITQIRIIGE